MQGQELDLWSLWVPSNSGHGVDVNQAPGRGAHTAEGGEGLVGTSASILEESLLQHPLGTALRDVFMVSLLLEPSPQPRAVWSSVCLLVFSFLHLPWSKGVAQNYLDL